MQITLNGKTHDVVEGLNIQDLLKQKGLNPEAVIVEYNYELLKKEDWTRTFLKEKDLLEILHFVGGG